MTRWGIAGPPPEAYSRVTNPERFLPLHGFALELVDQLRRDYEVTERSTFELIPGVMRPFEHALPPVTLTPTRADAAPIAIGFTRFPSLIVRCGRWFYSEFPGCGCDACDATAEGEIQRVDELVQDVVAGYFIEELRIPWLRSARVRWQHGPAMVGADYRAAGGRVLRAEDAEALRTAGIGLVEWRPWGRRGGRVESLPPG